MGDILKKIQGMPIEEKLRRLADVDKAYVLGYLDRAILECGIKNRSRTNRKPAVPEEEPLEKKGGDSKKARTGGKYG